MARWLAIEGQRWIPRRLESEALDRMPLDDGDVMAVIEEIGRTFDWDESLSGLAPVQSWHSKTSTFVHARGQPDAPGVVLKMGKDWEPEDARAIYEQLLGLQELARGSHLKISVPAILGWHGDPPSVCFEYVEGEDLDEMLDRRSGYSSPEAERAVEEGGSLLGLFHVRGGVGADDLSQAEGAARSRLESMAEQLRIRKGPLESIDLGDRISRRYGDYAPYNVRMGPAGDAWLLDQPGPPSLDLIHRDVSWYTFALIRNVGRDADADSAELGRAKDRLVAAFLSGYARTGPTSLDSAEDEALLALHYAHFFLWAAKRRWRQRRFGEVPRHLRLAQQWRRSVLRAMRS